MGKHFLFTCPPGHGHINPTLPLVEELVRRGNRITYATSERFADAVTAAGATLLPAYSAFPSAPPQLGFTPEQIAQRVGIFEEIIRTDFPTILAHAKQDPPDAVCYDILAGVGRMIAEKLGVADIALAPTHASNDHFSLRDRVFAHSSFEQAGVLTQAFQGLRDFAAEQGINADTSPIGGANGSLNIVFLPREFQIEGDTFDDRFRFVGPVMGRRPYTGDWQPPADDAPLLFISLGTVWNNQPEFFRLCLEAFRDTDWHVAIATGENIDPAELGPIPGNIELRSYFPQLEVLRRADAFLSHTGMNSTMEALAAAVPLIAVPQMPEQELNASRVRELGLGRQLDPAALTADSLRNTVTEVAADGTIRANLEIMGKAIQRAGGATAAANAIEAHVAG